MARSIDYRNTSPVPYRKIVKWFRDRGMKVLSPSWCSEDYCSGDFDGALVVSTEQQTSDSPIVATTIHYYENHDGSPEFESFLKDNGLWYEWNDGATICIYED